ncbi:MAG TPA: hypothetical protein VEZ11_10115 [Thermoanaerobaculia bacterium]|nr:hypothetical protein [Thermoanaerobaculia bacterium]
MRSTTLAALLFSIAMLASVAARAQDVGQGAIVVREGKAPIYAEAEGDEIEAEVSQNDLVAGVTSMGPLLHAYSFETAASGRIRVAYIAANKRQFFQKPYRTAWMNPADLMMFTYDCSCGFNLFHGMQTEACSPFAPSFPRFKWNDCFTQGRDTKLAENQARETAPQQVAAAVEPESDPALSPDVIVKLTSGDGQPAPLDASKVAASEKGPKPVSKASIDNSDKPLSAEDIAKLTADDGSGDKSSNNARRSPRVLTNDDVIKLVKAGFADKVVIDKIRASSGAELDTSTDALIRLKRAGVTSAVIDAMVRREGER